MAETVYTFDGVSFTHTFSGDEFEPWFNADIQYTKDDVLYDTSSGVITTSYIDIGAKAYPALQIRAQCASQTVKNNLLAKLLTQGTLSNTRSRSATCRLMQAKDIDRGHPSLFFVDCTFEYIS